MYVYRYKIKNIEETEAAKADLMANRGKPAPPTLPTYVPSYTRHFV
jgi:hypothetical protein